MNLYKDKVMTYFDYISFHCHLRLSHISCVTHDIFNHGGIFSHSNLNILFFFIFIGAGDKPARDQLAMRIEKRRRLGKIDGPKCLSDLKNTKGNNEFAGFEKHSTGIGSFILKKQGWNKGEGVGKNKQGITEPVVLEWKHPKKRIGLGYYGEKLDHNVSLKRSIAERDVYISTKYDEPDGEEINAMRFYGKELLKYRTAKVDFERAGKS